MGLSSSTGSRAAATRALARIHAATVGGPRRSTVVLALTGSTLATASLIAGPYLWFRPNRILDGASVTALEAFGATGWLLVALWIASGVLALRPGALAALGGGPARGLIATIALAATFALAGEAAAAFAETSERVARTSFGASYYVGLFGAFLVLYAAAADSRNRWLRALVWLAPLAALTALAVTGVLDEIGIVREWSMWRDTFSREIRRHLAYALGATIGAVAVGVPLGVLSAKNRRAETLVMGALNVGQVFPALAFVGLMMPLLGVVGDRISFLGALGVSGIGWAPVLVVLLVYALYPVTRNTTVAIRRLDSSVLDSARGMGMGRWRLLAEVELPLAFPVVLAGVRVALVQSTAGAIVAAFVGGGGLGAIMFFGLEQTSMDLVLVGVVPIVALALAFDTGLRTLEKVASRPGTPVTSQ